MAKPITTLLQRLKDEREKSDLISSMEDLSVSTRPEFERRTRVDSATDNGPSRRGAHTAHRSGQFQNLPRPHQHNPPYPNERTQSLNRRGGRGVRGRQGGRYQLQGDPTDHHQEAGRGNNHGGGSRGQRNHGPRRGGRIRQGGRGTSAGSDQQQDDINPNNNGTRPRSQSTEPQRYVHLNTNHRRDHRKANVLTAHRLKRYNENEPSAILLELAHDYSGLEEFVNSERLSSECVLLMLSVLAKACRCQSHPQNLISILNRLPRSAFLADGVTRIILNIDQCNEENKKNKIVMDVLLILREMFRRLPNACADQTGILALLKRAVNQIQNESNDIDSDMMECLNEVTELEEKKLNRLKSMTHKAKGFRDMDDEIPPEDYRTFSLLPTMEDLDPNIKPFLRKNKIHGKYGNIEHYLDVQFRLLREDFIYPLRQGIAEYKNWKRSKRLQDIRVYENVTIVRSVCSKSDLLYRLQFDTSKLKRVNWKISKRLIYGSLVCLSSDDFKTFYTATVSDRNEILLKDGTIDVKFEHDLHEIDSIESNEQFVMVETTAYYEAYKHVLKALQQIESLPFDRYIVLGDSQVQTPKYLRRHPYFDLRPLVDDEIILRNDRNRNPLLMGELYNFSRTSAPAKNVNVSDLREWPSGELLNLDDSQYTALQTSLSKEFSVIQGPPGTGKTYLGLKIVKALLHNITTWQDVDEISRPMLIVCYTNHALDQFLSGIVGFFKGNVVRVGGRISDESLKNYSLRAWKDKARIEKRFRDLGRLASIHKEKLDMCHREIEETGQRIDAAKSGVLTIDTIRHVIKTEHLEQLECIGDIALWLGLNGPVYKNMDQRNEPEDEDQEEDESIDVEEDAHIAKNNRYLLEDENDENLDFDTIRQRSRDKVQQCIAFDISMLDSEGFQMPREQVKKRKKQITRLMKSENRLSEYDADHIQNINSIELDTRWRLYKYWVYKFCEQLKNKVTAKNEEYKDACLAQREITLEKEKKILREADVIAMTTTGAARYQSLLQEVNPRIIIVEEAAEVLEGHIISTLSPACEQLILIGDHKQLRPNPNVYKLAKDYHLDISLFERMLQNGVRCDTLELQHRMRPEISKLMKPIYPHLKDHKSVERYEQMKGITKNVFFIKHNEPETHDTESRSHSNEYEARYVTELSDYFLKQGYRPEQITILVAYSGQMFQCKKLMPKKRFQGVRITPIDNYQGEENDIIILSLVRSNREHNIGFLKIENRICVALSRAKVGLYVIGNFDILETQSELWLKLTSMLKTTDEIGETLLLRCQNHPNDPGIEIKCPADFKKAPAGGCQKMCKTRLDCGHVCAMACHPVDPNHEDYDCVKPCPKKCPLGHPCKRKCYQDCEECTTQVLKPIPKCGHEDWVPCYKSPQEHKCTNPCTKTLQCGHPCGNLCGFGHACRTLIEHVFPCGHSSRISCPDRDKAKCREPCHEILECGHVCQGTCSACSTGRLHQPCGRGCNRTLVCGHTCTSFCSECPPCSKNCQNQCLHSKCKKKCGEVCSPCTEPCEWECDHFKCTKRCFEPCDRPKCNKPCTKLLKCRHPCIGLCGEPCPRYCRICNEDVVKDILFGEEDEEFARFVQLPDCGHIIEYKGLDKWMEIKSDTTTNFLLKSCPRCKTPIRRCVRYGQSINEILQMINDVKTKCNGSRVDTEQHRDELKFKIKTRIAQYQRKNNLDYLKPTKAMNDKLLGCTTNKQLVYLENQCTILFRALDEFEKFISLLSSRRQATIISQSKVVKSLINFTEWLTSKRDGFSKQEESDATKELSRQRCFYKLILQEMAVVKRGLQLTNEAKKMLQRSSLLLKTGRPLTESDEMDLKKTLRLLEEIAPPSGLGIDESERLEILKAMELTKGHWFKCPNGHIYAIGECGGATEEGTCPECKSTIGGRSHALRSDNHLATEMDGASHAAWSEQTNLNNYGFDALY